MTTIFNPTLAATWTSQPCAPCASANPVVTMTNQPVLISPAHLRIASDSGLYINSCGELDLHSHSGGNSSNTTVVSGNSCQYQWAISPSQVASGGLVTFTAIGLPASQAFQVLVQGNNSEFIWQLVSDAQGKVLGEQLQLPANGSIFMFKPITAGCTALPASREVVMSSTNAPVSTTCNGTVTVNPQFSLQQTPAGQSVILTLVISNTNSNPVSNVTLPTVAMPSTLTGQAVTFQQVSLAGNSQITRSYILIPSNATIDDLVATVAVPSNSGTYQCGGQTYSLGGGQTSLVIKAGIQVTCGLEIQALTLYPNPLVSGSTVTATLVLRNSGNTTITNVVLNSLLFDTPPTVTSSPVNATMSIAGVSISAGATHTETTQFTLTKSAGGAVVHTVTIPANAVTATCNGSLIGNTLPYSTTIVIN